MNSLRDYDRVLLSQVKHTVVAVDLLNLQERPIAHIEGQIINGSYSIDGDSAIRRTLNLTFVTTDSNYKILETSNPLAINKKIKVSIGIIDLTNPFMEEPLWFPCGTYVMTTCKSNADVNSQKITITCLDKMCLHNGEIAGKLEYTTRLDSEDITPTYINYITNLQTDYELLKKDLNKKETYLTSMEVNINTIYREVEGLNSILEAECIQLLTLINKIRTTENSDRETIDNLLIEFSEGITELFVNSRRKKLLIKDIIKYAAISLGGELPGKVIINDVPEKIKTPIYVDKNGTIGYKMISFIYPNELTLNTGDVVTTVYEKCKQALGGNYEYFYDVEGNFIFQEIKNYLDNTIVPLNELRNSNYKYSFEKTPIQFDFSKYNIVSSYAASPNWKNIKNDFYVWGNNEEALIGYHLVIDDKPVVPNYVKDYTREDQKLDWREYIVHDFDIGTNNRFIGKCYKEQLNEMPHDKIGDVCCYVDKELLIPQYKIWNGSEWENLNLALVTKSLEQNPYYRELKGIWIKDHYKDNFEPKPKESYNYHFDIIEGDKDLSKFSVNTIGRRKEPIMDKDIKQLYPTIIEEILVYYDDEDLQYTSRPENAIKLTSPTDFKEYAAAGNIYKDAFSRIKQLLFKHTTYNEQLAITSVPIYNLEVNRRCYAYFEKTNTSGFYLIKKMSINLDATGTMTTNLIKAEQRERGVSRKPSSNNTTMIAENGI